MGCTGERYSNMTFSVNSHNSIVNNSPVNISEIVQIDGNVTANSDIVDNIDKISASSNLPIVASYNCRSLFPKVESFKTDVLERMVDVSFTCEIWEKKENKLHKQEIEKMLEMNGLKYISNPRPSTRNGGGVAIVVNCERFSCERLNIYIPGGLEVVYGLLKPKCSSAKYKKIILCSFYSPPTTRRNSKLADHIVGTLQMLSTKYPNCQIILGGDKKQMDITPILNCGLREVIIKKKNESMDSVQTFLDPPHAPLK